MPILSGLTDSMDESRKNTDRELWRESDAYGAAIFITEDERLGIRVGGRVIVMPVERWHELALKTR